MIEEIQQVSNDSILQDKLKEAMIKQMEIGYQEMAEINLNISNESFHLESESELINENIWKSEW